MCAFARWFGWVTAVSAVGFTLGFSQILPGIYTTFAWVMGSIKQAYSGKSGISSVPPNTC